MLRSMVHETVSAPGTSTNVTLAGVVTGFRSFGAACGSGDPIYYYMRDASQYEGGHGTFTSPNVVARTTVLHNSAGTTSRLNFAGTTDIFISLPAEKMILLDPTGLMITGAGVRANLSARVKLTSDKATTTGTGAFVSWDAAVHDDAALWNAGDPSKLTVPAGGFTRAELTCNLLWQGGSSGYRTVDIRKNGFLFDGSPGHTTWPGSTDAPGQNIHVLDVPVTTGDYFQVRVVQNSGGSLNVVANSLSSFAMKLIR